MVRKTMQERPPINGKEGCKRAVQSDLVMGLMFSKDDGLCENQKHVY